MWRGRRGLPRRRRSVRDGAGVRRAVPGDGVFVRGRGRDGRVAGGGGSASNAASASTSRTSRSSSTMRSSSSCFAGPGRGRSRVSICPRTSRRSDSRRPRRRSARSRGDDTLLATSAAYLPEAARRLGVVRRARRWRPRRGRRPGTTRTTRPSRSASSWRGFQRALATPSPILPDPVTTADAATIAGWRDRTPSRRSTRRSPVTEGPAGERLRAREVDARRVLDGFARVHETPMTRIHGDLHVGQVLRVPDGRLFVSDLDGESARAGRERIEPGSPARDVASMACAIDHVGRVVVRRHPSTGDAIDAWIGRARAAFLDGVPGGAPTRARGSSTSGCFTRSTSRRRRTSSSTRRDTSRGGRYVPDVALPAVLAWDDV